VVSPGDCFHFTSKHGELRLVLLVLEVHPVDSCRVDSTVFVLDATELADEFRARAGQTTSWMFDSRDPEWQQLRRVL